MPKILNIFTARQLTWIAALESGTYAQAIGHLEVIGKGFCCLGVGCKALLPDGNRHTYINEPVNNLGKYLGEISQMPTELSQDLRLYDESGRFHHSVAIELHGDEFQAESLAEMNDQKLMDFTQIAAFMRVYPWLVFTNFDSAYSSPDQDAPRALLAAANIIIEE
jgi:hypothetical protein